MNEIALNLLTRIALAIFALLSISLFLKDKYSDHELVQSLDEALQEHAPALMEAENLYKDVKTSVATSSISESDAKFKAWQQWYEVPEKCRKEVLGNNFVECTDHSIDARREFEAWWRENREVEAR